MLFWALMASGQITMRRVGGWQTLDQAPVKQLIDPHKTDDYDRPVVTAVRREVDSDQARWVQKIYAREAVVSDSWWKFDLGVAPDHDGHSIKRRGQAAA